MIHYSCDRCHKLIDPDAEVRYVLRIELQVAADVPRAGDEDADHLGDLDVSLQGLSAEQVELSAPLAESSRRFDLCSDCYRVFVQNPLNQESPHPLHFSQN